MKFHLFALCILSSIAAVHCRRQLKDIDLDDTCCSPITFDDQTGSLLVAREDDRDDCQLDDDVDDEEKRLYEYFLYTNGTCYIRSSEPCSRFVRESNSDDDDFSQSCTDAQVTEYNAKFQTAFEQLRTQGPSPSLSAVSYAAPPPGNSSDNDNDDDDDDDNDDDGDK